MRIKINTMTYGGNASAPVHHPTGTSDDHAAHGARATLDVLFDAPAVVKHALCDNCNLNNTFVVEHEQDVDKMFANTNARLVYSPGGRHFKNVSRCARWQMPPPIANFALQLRVDFKPAATTRSTTSTAHDDDLL